MLVSGAMCCTLDECGGEPDREPCLDDIRLIKTGLGLFMSLANWFCMCCRILV